MQTLKESISVAIKNFQLTQVIIHKLDHANERMYNSISILQRGIVNLTSIFS